jgi:hypothetical protein|tara:strand:- start:234 stop:794 length:561 start_codon:yes stop_codon:yes gene_type:complete
MENVSFAFVLITLFVVAYLFYKQTNHDANHYINESHHMLLNRKPIYERSTVNYPHSNLPKDVLLNPYTPPLSDQRFAINTPTNIGAVDTNYRQIGILTQLNKTSKDMILSLLGRPVFKNRELWQYYTISNQFNSVKLPISVGGKSASSEYGVRQIYSGDTIFVEGYDSAFRATIYDNDVIRYIPFG